MFLGHLECKVKVVHIIALFRERERERVCVCSEKERESVCVFRDRGISPQVGQVLERIFDKRVQAYKLCNVTFLRES